MGKLQWGDRVMLLFLNGKSGGDGGSSCGGAAVKKKISLRGVDNNCSKDGNVPSPDPRPVKKKITSKGVIDEISRLPDELLVSILSCLSLKEAVASSILSRRWRFLWTSISKLDFEGFDLWTSFKPKPDFEILCCPCSQSKPEASIRESWEYVRWVDDVLGLRNKSSAAIDELRISFSLHAAHQSYINRWIEFALDKKVVRLDMNLALTYFTKMYTFPHKLMCNNDFHSWGFKGLRLIRMVCVYLSDDALEIFLCSCPLLEEIFFAECCGFSTVKIVNSLSALKRLTIVSCHNLESIEVRDSNLVYFMYSALAGPLKHFLLKNVPLLVEMYVGGPLTNNVEEFLAMFSSCLPQLEKLTIHKRIPLSIREADMICSSVKMSNLKQLVWKSQWFYAGFPDWEGVAYLVGALPLLQRLVVTSNHDMMKANVRSCSESAFPYKRTYAYSHLKQVEFVGYHGNYDELAMLMHFVAYAAALEEVIIHPAKNTFIELEFGEYTKHEMDAFRFFAKVQLTTRLPSTVTLKIL